MIDFWDYEKELLESGIYPVCGVDEAGRGPLAGPVCAGAVILPLDCALDGLDDSKKLSEKKREALYERITEQAISWAVGWASVEEIEERNILGATFLAMNRAIAGLDRAPVYALVDGNTVAGIELPGKSIVGGDGLCASIAAASILAKVSRDRLMVRLAEQYPQYGFEKHKGYGTKQHYAALSQFGPCEHHRPSFLKKLH